MFKYNLDLQNFANANTQLGSAVVGHRMFIMTDHCVPTTADLANPILGVRSTPDLGSSQNTVEANTIGSIREENVLGLYPATDIEYTFLFSKTMVEQQKTFINKEVWVFEERENMTQSPTKVGNGIIYKVKMSGLVVNGQTPEGLQEMTQSGTMISDETYLATPTYADSGSGEPTWTILGLQTGKTTTADALNSGTQATNVSNLSLDDSSLKQ